MPETSCDEPPARVELRDHGARDDVARGKLHPFAFA